MPSRNFWSQISKGHASFSGESWAFRWYSVTATLPTMRRWGATEARLNLRRVEMCAGGPVIDWAVRDRDGLLSASMTVGTADEIKLLFTEFQSAGVTFHQKLKKQPWGAKNFVVKDPDGNLLLFAGPGN